MTPMWCSTIPLSCNQTKKWLPCTWTFTGQFLATLKLFSNRSIGKCVSLPGGVEMVGSARRVGLPVAQTTVTVLWFVEAKQVYQAQSITPALWGWGGWRGAPDPDFFLSLIAVSLRLQGVRWLLVLSSTAFQWLVSGFVCVCVCAVIAKPLNYGIMPDLPVCNRPAPLSLTSKCFCMSSSTPEKEREIGFSAVWRRYRSLSIMEGTLISTYLSFVHFWSVKNTGRFYDNTTIKDDECMTVCDPLNTYTLKSNSQSLFWYVQEWLWSESSQ